MEEGRGAAVGEDHALPLRLAGEIGHPLDEPPPLVVEGELAVGDAAEELAALAHPAGGVVGDRLAVQEPVLELGGAQQPSLGVVGRRVAVEAAVQEGVLFADPAGFVQDVALFGGFHDDDPIISLWGDEGSGSRLSRSRA